MALTSFRLCMLTWNSLNFNAFIESVYETLNEVELMVDRVIDLIEFRIEKILNDIANTKLVELPTDTPWTIDEFIKRTEVLCKKGAETIESKSQYVEKATNELCMMLLTVEQNVEQQNENVDEDEEDGERQQSPDLVKSRPKSRLGSAAVSPTRAAAKRKREMLEVLVERANELLNYYNHQNLEALNKVIRSTLDAIRKRIHATATILYKERTQQNLEETGSLAPFFYSDFVLKIPNVSMSPSLDEIQQAINKCTHVILSITKNITMWDSNVKALTTSSSDELETKTDFEQETSLSVNEAATRSRAGSLLSSVNDDDGLSTIQSIAKVRKSYYRSVSHNKEIAKLVGSMSTIINSQKKEVTGAFSHYEQYNTIWLVDKEMSMEKFLQKNPTLDEFEQQILSYKEIEEKVKMEDERMNVGSVCLLTEQIKLGIITEIKSWIVIYGRSANSKYRTAMVDFFKFINSFTKQLSRPLNDLDDIRFAMATLIELRNQEIVMDMEVTPIEDSFAMLTKYNITVSKDDIERVDTLRYAWKNLLLLAKEVQDELLQLQPVFKSDLTAKVEQFKQDSEDFVKSYQKRGPMTPNLPPHEANERLITYQNRFDTLYRQYVTYSGGEELFGLPITEYDGLQQIRKELSLLHKLYGLYNDVTHKVNGYYDIPWIEVNTDKINGELQDFQTRCRKLPRGLKDWQAYLDLKKQIDDFNESCPLLEMMANKAMKARHWKKIGEITNHQFDVESETFLLKNIMEAPLLENKEDIEDICIAATKEKDIEAKLKTVIADWNHQELTFATFKSRGELLLRGDSTSEIITLLEDSLMVLGSLLSNRYNAPFKKQIQSWVQKLSNSTDILENWMVVQNLWIYLEAVFVGGDIARQLPREAKRFSGIDKNWQKIMQRAHEMPNVVVCCTGDEALSQLLPHLQEQLELCQKSLSGYLEKKRLVFPRFFFVSDPALLEILGQASDSHTIQNHLLNVFDNTKHVEFHEKDYDKILAVISKEGEKVVLDKYVMAFGNVEEWLNNLLKMSQSSVHGVIRQAYHAISDSNFDVMEFLGTFPAQIGLLGLQMLWTRDSTDALQNNKYDKKVMSETNQAFLELLNLLIEQTTKDLSSVERTKYESLITIHVHQRDIFDDLVKMHIKSPNDFEWLKQIRFYFLEDMDQCLVSITDVDFKYQNEFIGCVERLVITPLTDRCYITLAQALNMSMGASPAGPAGTGKTETVKDMGKALGKYVIVFNCSDQLDYRGLGRIFKGLAQSGSWGCFDEFNRIDLPVLSVAAQQIHVILSCKKERKPEFLFTDGDTVAMNPEFGLFLTMNPGYAGRQELPENLKVQFRTVAMMVPDRQIIIRVKLASCGFLDNIVLARKFFTLYKLCEEQLTKQVHYDFGLRNMLSVLRTLGQAKRNNPSDSESKIVMRVLRDMNLSKLVDEDEPLFLSLINDLFPAISLDKAGYPNLEAAIDAKCQESGLVNHPSWSLKLIQLYETQRVRHGMMALGPSGTGKTTCIHTLMKAMTEIGLPHREYRMNPKAITAPQMFGKLDVATNDWTDGIFSTLWRKTLRAKKGERIWIVLDGPVDAIWIENLNSVLDDNKTLTLANGDRIPMSPFCKVVFEPHNIDNASPATVSRNGMVYMSSSCLDWRPILEAWLLKRDLVEAETLRTLYHKSFQELLIFMTENVSPKIELLECNYVTQSINVLNGLLPTPSEGTTFSPQHVSKLYVFALMWSLGATLELDDRVKMEIFIKNHLDLDLPNIDEASSQTIFEYFVDREGKWCHWSSRVEEYIYPTDHNPEYSSILVPNVDNVRTNFLIDTIAKQGKAALLIGEQGTAKTIMIQSYMKHYDPEVHLNKRFNFSSASTPMHFQRTIESYVDKRMGSTYGPVAGKRMSVFIDDINMPVINEWGDQVTNEIVRQLMSDGGFYNLDKPGDFTTIVDIQFLAAMIHPGGGRKDIPERLKRQFSIFNCTLPSNNSIDKIFGVICRGHFCKERGFTDEVRTLANDLVACTRRLWQYTKVKMLPTPAKFHYVFNLRDLSRIWQGMLNAVSDVITETSTLLSLWQHECTRVICDRFVNETDKSWFRKVAVQICNEEIGENHDLSCLEEEAYFVDFLRDAPEPTGDEPDDADFEAPKIYEPIESMDSLRERLSHFMHQYNESVRGSGLDLVFFEDAITSLLKISRILATPRGNALLVGVGGSGKQSLTRLASFIAGYKTFQITITRSYNLTNLMEDLKYLYRVAGEQGKGITFVFTDQEVKDEGFLEYLNNVLSSGEVSNLFARDEIDEITSELIPVMKKEYPRRPPTSENLYEYFINRARSNLHVVLCFSPVGEKFRQRALQFPGLISGCTINWFQRWPKEALIQVAMHYLSNFEIKCTEETKNELVKAMGSIHDGVAVYCKDYFERFRRQTHVTPKSYLSFMNSYKQVYAAQKTEIDGLAHRMNIGLDKLMEASRSVAELSKELLVKEKELAVASVKAEAVLKEVTQKAHAAEKVKSQVQEVKDRAQAIVDVIGEDKAVAEVKLEAAKPALEEAEAALQTIKAADIATVRRLGKPPPLIMRIMDCVLILSRKGLDPVTPDPDRPGNKASWSESLRFMSQAGFLQALQEFPKDTINEEMVELMEPYFKAEDYTMENAKRVCGNVAGLCSWTKAMAKFFSVNKEVLPLKANLSIQEAKLELAMSDLQTAQQQLDEKQKELDAAQAEYESAMREKQILVDDAETCKRKMVAASALINGLGGEKERWTEQSKEFAQQTERLVGDVLLGTAFLSYSGPFNQEFRKSLEKNWQKELHQRQIPFTFKLNVTSLLVDTATLAEWNLQGLPNDELSSQNGIIVSKAARYPLLIDPQSQGKIWIKNKEKDHGLQVTSLNHKYFRTHLEDALSLGRPLLIEDVGEELDPVLDNILEKNFIKLGSSFKVKLGDKEVDVMNGFTMYITTKLPNPSYTPEISARTSMIDFTVTMKGLEDQLLGRVILTEKSELEAERLKLIEDVSFNKRKMKELEDNLLYRLTSVEGSLVDDESLIEVLSITKRTAEEVAQKLAVAADTELKINNAREEFRNVATRGSILYFLIVEMSFVNCMYQTSLKQFLGIFDQAIERSPQSPITTKRITNIIACLTYDVFKYSCRGLYEKDKFLFTLLLALKIDIQSNLIKHREFSTFIKGGASLDLKQVPPKPCKWILDMTWLNLVELSKLPQFTDILNQIGRNEKQWKVWFDKETPEEAEIPDGYHISLDTFRKLLLVRSWAPDRTLSQARKYIEESLGRKYAEGVILDLHETWSESDTKTPLICFLSMGSDPTVSIEQLAKRMKLECRAVSMGQGQEIHARRLINQSMQTGGWVLLQNCHLGLPFMDELMNLITTSDNVDNSFRLWITTEVHPLFPITLLQMSIKFTNEPPQGLKPGLKRTYTGITQDQLDITNLHQWKPMLYAVAFLHTTVQERRKFGSLGWNIPYEFNQSDFSSSVQFIQNHLDDMDIKRGVSWTTVRYMIGQVQYGGRVTDDYDKRLLNTFTKVWFSESMFLPTFKFYHGYTIPKCNKCDHYLDYIESLPTVDNPEVFGLHPNADITYQSSVAKSCLATILSIQPKDSAATGGETREAVVQRLADDMLEKLPPNYLKHEVRSKLQKMGQYQPINIFLRQEIDRMQRVIASVRTTLMDLKLAIDGTIIMNETLRDSLDCIYDARIPSHWQRISWESSTLGFWFTELLERNTQFSVWINEGRPHSFWMTGFFNPQGFLTAMRQEVTRAHKGWALDSVILQNDVLKHYKDDITSAPTEGVYVYGLFLEGAGWDRRGNKLVEPPSKVLFTPMPVIHIYAANNPPSKEQSRYPCPIYKKPVRTDLTFVTEVDLRTVQSPDHWILRGVALLCDIK
ncbi:dynein axonemal heavy chain 5-like [Clytia hemisphaerica]